MSSLSFLLKSIAISCGKAMLIKIASKDDSVHARRADRSSEALLTIQLLFQQISEICFTMFGLSSTTKISIPWVVSTYVSFVAISFDAIRFILYKRRPSVLINLTATFWILSNYIRYAFFHMPYFCFRFGNYIGVSFLSPKFH